MKKQNIAQGSIEYLLIIAAAIIVVAIVITAISGALGSGDDSGEVAKATYLDQLGELEKMRLQNLGLLTMGELLSDETLNKTITRADGSEIENTQDLQDAYAAGEFVIYKAGEEINTFEKGVSLDSEHNITKCTRNLNKILTVIEVEPQVSPGKVAKLISPSPTHSLNYLADKPMIMYSSGNQQTSYLRTKYSELYDECFSGGFNTLNEFKIEFYDYTFVLGPSTAPGEIGLELNDGYITGIDSTSELNCENNTRFCALDSTTLNALMGTYPAACGADSTEPINECVVDGIIDVCASFSCLSNNCEPAEDNDPTFEYLICSDKTVSDLTIDYFHEND